MSISLDGIAVPGTAQGMVTLNAILGWQFPLRSWREQQSMIHRSQRLIDEDGGTNYTFVVGGIKAVICRARAVEAAGGKDVLVVGGVSIAQQTLANSADRRDRAARYRGAARQRYPPV